VTSEGCGVTSNAYGVTTTKCVLCQLPTLQQPCYSRVMVVLQ
jgi:hypothetical protein